MQEKTRVNRYCLASLKLTVIYDSLAALVKRVWEIGSCQRTRSENTLSV